MPNATWRDCTLDALVEMNPEALDGSTPPRSRFRYIDINSVTLGKIDWQSVSEVEFRSAPSRARRIIRPGDTLFCTVRPSLQAHAYADWDQQDGFICSTGFAVLRPKRADKRFIFHTIFSEAVALHVRRREVGSSYPAVNESDLKQTPLCVPESEFEQSRIGEILDTLDAAIRETEAVVAKLQQVKAGLLHDLLTRGVNDHGHLRDPARHPEQFQDSQLGLVPVGWEIRTLEQITDPRAPICYGIVQVFDHIPNGVLVLAIRDLLGDYATGLHRTLPSIDASYSRSRVRPDDVLISIKGTIGRIGIVPSHYVGNISRDLARIRPVQSVMPRFLLHLLRSPGGQKTLELAQVGTTRAELSIAPLKGLKFAFPTTEEQRRIAGILDEHDLLIVVNEVKLEKLRSLKGGLAHDLLTGCARVRI